MASARSADQYDPHLCLKGYVGVLFSNSVAVMEDCQVIPSDFPRISKDFIEALDALYPERCPEPQWSDREIWMRVGERRVVRALQRIFDEQNRNILEEKLNVHE